MKETVKDEILRHFSKKAFHPEITRFLTGGIYLVMYRGEGFHLEAHIFYANLVLTMRNNQVYFFRKRVCLFFFKKLPLTIDEKFTLGEVGYILCKEAFSQKMERIRASF